MTLSPSITILDLRPHSEAFGKRKISLNENHDLKTKVEGKIGEHHNLKKTVYRVLGTSEGLFRFGQLMQRLPQWINAVRVGVFGVNGLPALDRLSEKSLSGWIWCATFPRIITLTPETLDSVRDARKAIREGTLPHEQVQYKVEKAIGDVVEAGAMYCNGASITASLFPNATKIGGTFKTAAELATFGRDLLSFRSNSTNLMLASSIDISKATAEMKQTIRDTKRHDMLALAKDICSIVSGILGLYLLATGVALAPAVALATLSLGTVVFAILRKLYQETMIFKPIDFLDSKHVALLTHPFK